MKIERTGLMMIQLGWLIVRTAVLDVILYRGGEADFDRKETDFPGDFLYLRTDDFRSFLQSDRPRWERNYHFLPGLYFNWLDMYSSEWRARARAQ